VKKRVLLIPQYMKKFQCIGISCEDNCCYGWKVNIDEITYKKYKKVSESTLKHLIEKNVTRNRSNPSTENYAKMVVALFWRRINCVASKGN
jgi:lysine-N-methylase